MSIRDTASDTTAVGGIGIGSIVAGAIAGITGGIVFGIMMTMMGMMPMVAGLVGSNSVGIGWVVHLVIATAIGVIYRLVLGSFGGTIARGWWLGVIYGVIWWVLGPLLIMPSLMGMGPQFGLAFSGQMRMSLVGHVIYGVIVGVVYPLAREWLA